MLHVSEERAAIVMKKKAVWDLVVRMYVLHLNGIMDNHGAFIITMLVLDVPILLSQPALY